MITNRVVHPSGDSGFYIRTIIKPPEQAHGLQIQVGPPKSGNGRIYESYGRGWIDLPKIDPADIPSGKTKKNLMSLVWERWNPEEKKFLKPEDWNDLLITAQDGDVTVCVNGTKTAELKGDKSRQEGHFALQMHSGTVMEVRFKDIQIQDR
jgi:hypothetical protein